MSSEIKGQNQVPGESARFLHTTSVTGGKINFIEQTTFGSASFTISAGTYHTVNVTLSLWPEDLPTVARTATNMIQPDKAIAWPYFKIYIDTDANSNYMWASGSSLSDAQKKIQISVLNKSEPSVYSGSSLYSAETSVLMYNGDASDHTIYFNINYKYIITES